MEGSTAAMTIEITSPDVEALIRQRMEAGSFKSPEDLIREVLKSSPGERTLAPASAAERRRAAGRKSLVEVFAPLRGMNLDFGRNQSAGRPVDLG
jgi:Arc/MetJ-type ribon-helix-helix transcriptional regulator